MNVTFSKYYVRRTKYVFTLCAMLYALCFFTLCTMPHALCLFAAEPDLDSNAALSIADEEQPPVDEVREKPKSLVLKMMVVNPSDKYKQTYSMKAYLPEEIQPDYIMAKEDLELGYDAEKKAYFVSKDIELEPGQSTVKAIEVEDVWLISQKEMEALSSEASDLYVKLKETKYEQNGRLLLSNVEVLLTQIFERQNDETVTPEEHISIYRENRQKIRDIELDIVALRRLVANARGEAGLLPGQQGQTAFMTQWEREAAKVRSTGAIPAAVAWRVIFGILIFVGVVSLGFYITWQRQIHLIRKGRKVSEDESINLDELFGGKPAESLTAKPPPMVEEDIERPSDAA